MSNYERYVCYDPQTGTSSLLPEWMCWKEEVRRQKAVFERNRKVIRRHPELFWPFEKHPRDRMFEMMGFDVEMTRAEIIRFEEMPYYETRD